MTADLNHEDVVQRVISASADPAFAATLSTARDIALGWLRERGNCGETVEMIVTLAAGVAIATTVNAPPDVSERINAMGPLGAALREAWALRGDDGGNR